MHPQVVAENGPDSAHFRYVHHATVTPRLLDWHVDGHEWGMVAGWPDAGSASQDKGGDQDKMALVLHSNLFGLGGAISAFQGSAQGRLIFACTPVDDEYSNMFYSIWWPREPGDDSDVPPADVVRRVEKQFLVTVWDDLEIWRYMEYVDRPPLSKVDADPCFALRKWAQQFYEVPPARTARPGAVSLEGS